MTVKRSYSCDLCGTAEEPIGKAELYGIWWTALNAIEPKGVRESEHHLCRLCIESIQRNFNLPAERR
jgi:hypothetical protein